jgi:hypothetical protein
MIPLLTAQEARKLAKKDIPPKDMGEYILAACYAEIYVSAVTGHQSTGQDFGSADLDQKLVSSAVRRTAVRLRKQGFSVDIQGGTYADIGWEGVKP